MRQHGYNVGGEQSGHIVLSDYSTTGDGLVTALQILAVVAQSGKPVSEICNRFEPLPQILKNVRYKNGGQPLDNVAVRRAIDSGKSKLGKSGRLVIRPSGTEPMIRVMAEGDDEKLIKTVVSDIVHALTDADLLAEHPVVLHEVDDLEQREADDRLDHEVRRDADTEERRSWPPTGPPTSARR